MTDTEATTDTGVIIVTRAATIANFFSQTEHVFFVTKLPSAIPKFLQLRPRSFWNFAQLNPCNHHCCVCLLDLILASNPSPPPSPLSSYKNLCTLSTLTRFLFFFFLINVYMQPVGLWQTLSISILHDFTWLYAPCFFHFCSILPL